MHSAVVLAVDEGLRKVRVKAHCRYREPLLWRRFVCTQAALRLSVLVYMRCIEEDVLTNSRNGMAEGAYEGIKTGTEIFEVSIYSFPSAVVFTPER